jgi:hypothetical protein
MDPDIQDLVSRLVSKLQPTLPHSDLPLQERLMAALWPYLEPMGDVPAPPGQPFSAYDSPGQGKDKRVKSWQIQILFWCETPIGPELVASTDLETIRSTGSILELVPQYAQELHGALPDALSAEEVKPRLQQFRNNLARQAGAVLRIPYVLEGAQFLCQVDVMRLIALP